MSIPRASAVALLVAAAIVGCGGDPARLDTSSDEAAKASLERMRAGLTADQKNALNQDIAAVTLPGS